MKKIFLSALVLLVFIVVTNITWRWISPFWDLSLQKKDNTQYSVGYSDWRFFRIKVGDSEDFVFRTLGGGLQIIPVGGIKYVRYSAPVKEGVYAFREIGIKDGYVYVKSSALP